MISNVHLRLSATISIYICVLLYRIHSALKLIHMCSISSHLGPLQLSLKRILIDIFKFFSIYSLVLFSFACGLNQLMWYFADLERKKCYSLEESGSTETCSKWRNFGKWVTVYIDNIHSKTRIFIYSCERRLAI